MAKIILDKSDQEKILEKVKKEVLSSLSSELNNISEIRLFGSILRWEFGHIPEGKETSGGKRFWSDIDFLIIAKKEFEPLSSWKEKFKTNHGYWLCYHYPPGIEVNINFMGKEITLPVPVGFAIIYEDTLKDSAKKQQSIKDGLPLAKSFFKKTYERIY